MQTAARHILRKSVTLLAVVAGLAACARGFRAPGVMQAQSGTADSDKVLPNDSLQHIQSNTDPVTQTQDPILSQGANKNTSYKLPANSFATIRVRLLPITANHFQDAFKDSESADTVGLVNENGLVLKDLATTTKAFLVKGNTVMVVFSKKQITIDGKVYALDPQSQIGIFPRLSGSLTHVSLRLNNGVIKDARLSVDKQDELPFRGLFLLRQQSRAPAKGQAASSFWNLINYVALEDYVRSVVPSEIGSSSPPEALKAQALAARTFALHAMGVARCTGHSGPHCAPRVWDLDPTTGYQCYLGGLAEKQSTYAAIDATKGALLSFRGAPILAMYHASSGGETSSGAEYFCKAQKSVKGKGNCQAGDFAQSFPYLPGKKDPFNGSYQRSGPGVGLPQRSAQEMAKENYSVDEIIAQYYPGATVDKF